MLLTARTPSRYASALAALSVFMAALLLPLSFTGGVMTTPAIQQSLGGSPAALSWLTNGFMLTFGSFLLAAGVAADAIDRKRIFIAGAALFCLSSLLVLSDAQSLPVRRVEGAAGPGRGDDFSQRQCGAGPAV